MALFTGRQGDAELSRRRFAQYQADMDAQNLRNAARDKLDRTPDSKPISESTGTIPSMTTIAEPVQSVPDNAPDYTGYGADRQAAPVTTAGLNLGPVGQNNVTISGSRVAQSNRPQDSTFTQGVKQIVGNLDHNEDLNRIQYGLSLGGYGQPATNPIAQTYGFFTDTESEKLKREGAGEMVDWYDSDEAVAYFRQNPKQLDIANKNPKAFYESLKSVSQKAATAAATPVATRTALLPLAAARVKGLDQLLKSTDPAVIADRELALDLAAEIGVDSSAALAMWGIETDYGRNTGKGKKGVASGTMQVTQPTYDSMKRWFGDFQNYSRNRIDPALKSLADSMSSKRGDKRSEMIAGLLRMKYSEIIGVPPQNLGAAYQTNAENVRENNGPLDIDDGNLSNADYNTVFNQLRAEAELMLSGNQRPAQVAVAPAAVATTPPAQTATAGVKVPASDAEASKTVATAIKAGVAELPDSEVKKALTSSNPKEPKMMGSMELVNKELYQGPR